MEGNRSDETKRRRAVTKMSSMPQLSPRKRRGGHNAKSSDTRQQFLYAFEKSFGNISASCEYAGIDRRTFYRWVASGSRVNLKFQKRLTELRPKEKQLDIAEGKLMERVYQGDMRAIELILRTRGRTRGYGEQIKASLSVLDRVALAFQDFERDHPELVQTFEDKWKWLVRFANGAKTPVEPEQLAGRLGINPAAF